MLAGPLTVTHRMYKHQLRGGKAVPDFCVVVFLNNARATYPKHIRKTTESDSTYFQQRKETALYAMLGSFRNHKYGNL